VALGGEVQDAGGTVGLEDAAHGLGVGHVALDEHDARVVRQVVAAAGVGERIEDDDEALGSAQQLDHDGAADEAGAAGDQGGGVGRVGGHAPV